MLPPRIARIAPLALVAVLLVTACGDAQETDTAAEAASDTTAVDDAATPATVAVPDLADGSDATVGTDAPAGGSADKPAVQIPAELPTELVVTDLVEGTGDGAETGDTVIVNYVGVRSEDGTEFDNSYDRGQPFPVTLGTGGVIPGWEQGLVGVKQGGRRQLDIPADLAYGDAPQGDVIQAGDALTFVIDVLVVLGQSDPADKPAVDIVPGTTVDSIVVEDLEQGSGDAVQVGQSVAFDYTFIRTDTGEELQSSWDGGGQQTLPFDDAQIPAGLYQAFDGAKVGTIRQITYPFSEASQLFELPGETDVVLVIKVNAFF